MTMMPPEAVDYEPLAQVRKAFRIPWYRCPIEPAKLRELAGRSDLKGAFQAVGHLALFACTGLSAYLFFLQQNWIGFSIALFAHGTVGSFFRGLSVHELGHGTVFRTKWLNSAFLRIYSLLGWWNFHEYAMSHTYHHRYTLHPRGDREVILPRDPSLKPAYLLQLFTFNVTGGLESNGLIPVLRETIATALGKYNREWIEALYAGHPGARKQAVNWARLILLFHAGILALAVSLQLWLLPVLLTLHVCIGNWLKYFVGLPMHCGLRSDVPDFRKCVRTIKLDPMSEFLYWHMNWHTEHHMFAAVPCYNLKRLHRAVAGDMPQPRSLVGAWREMRETWRKQQGDPGYAYDTPVPPPSRGEKEQDPLAASIGELAPKVLR